MRLKKSCQERKGSSRTGKLGRLSGGGGAERRLQHQHQPPHTAILRKAADSKRARRARARAKGGETQARDGRRQAAVRPRAGLVLGEKKEERAGTRAPERADSRQAAAAVGTRSFPQLEFRNREGRRRRRQEDRDHPAAACFCCHPGDVARCCSRSSAGQKGPGGAVLLSWVLTRRIPTLSLPPIFLNLAMGSNAAAAATASHACVCARVCVCV